MTSKSMVTKDSAITEPQILYVGEEIAIRVNVEGVVSTLSTPTQAFYKRNQDTDLSSTYFTGSLTASGTTIIVTKTTTGLKKGEYTLSVMAVVDGLTQVVATIPIIVKRRSET